MLIIAVDPGVTGAFCVLQGKRVLTIEDTPVHLQKKGKGEKRVYDDYTMGRLVYKWVAYAKQRGEKLAFVIEKVTAMPGQGVVSMFGLGYGLGLWIGAARGAGVGDDCIYKPAPATWKRIMGLDREKANSVALARKLYPAAVQPYLDLRMVRNGGLDVNRLHGRAEALLLAHYRRIA